MNLPEILAPAGDTHSFLAAVAAGADAVYCGLKIFSARMEADNFSIEELALLTRLARVRNIRVYVALNSLIKESELEKARRILSKLASYVDPDALIIQDPALISLARQAGFEKAFHLSTLGCLSFPAGMSQARSMGFEKIVLPREFTIDEIKQMAQTVPAGMGLEVFVHGALCYSVSGRCYWSSWFGGKSALRGRCVQPCRRMYEQNGVRKRYFSCLDFSADVLVKVLKQIPEVTTWKIEGRKKSPHYVYYTVRAYRLLRDRPDLKKEALACLNNALGRPFSHYRLLTQRPFNPLDHDSETGSGRFTGRIQNPRAPFFITREALMPSDLLRIGSEEDAFHEVQRVTRAIPKKGKFYLGRTSRGLIRSGTPVYLIDRRELELKTLIQNLENELNGMDRVSVRPSGQSSVAASQGRKVKKRSEIREMILSRDVGRPRRDKETGLWISSRDYTLQPSARTWLWLDPVLFPEDQALCADFIDRAIRKGARQFVLNAPWQISLFNNPGRLNLWAGPFCNIANHMTLNLMKQQGFSGAVVSPELDGKTLAALPAHSELPLGLVIYGNWPLGISRIMAEDLTSDRALTSPKGEIAWVTRRKRNCHVFPNWVLDLRPRQKELAEAGFSLFVHMVEPVPKCIRMKDRPGLWNFELNLL